jgi:hypothetical protein
MISISLFNQCRALLSRNTLTPGWDKLALDIAGNLSGELIYLFSIPTKDAKEND